MEALIFLIVPAILVFGFFQQSIERNRLLKAQLFFQLSERLDQDENFKKVEQILDDSESFNFTRLVTDEKASFEEYLRFFDSLTAMKIPDRFNRQESELLFGRAAALLNRHHAVRNHIAENYQNLDEVLTLNTQEKKKLSAASQR